MGTEQRKRYTFRDVPEALSVTVSHRIPELVSMLLNDRVAKLVEAGEIRNRSDALADALVTWLMVEEHQEQLRAATPDAERS
jgi:Arc/MetJ-type ribon-helix-helix transcriptional regulator